VSGVSVDLGAATATKPAEEVEPAVARDLVCARCRAGVTRESARIERGGAHVHTRINPGGWVFQLGCFAEATCRVSDEPTEQFTWFPGHAWRVASCVACDAHLGWRFDGAGGTFFGLILDRLANG
jgi:hypothetical protein